MRSIAARRDKGESGTMYRIVLACNGVPAHVGEAAARDITEEFTHRPWHQNVSCGWNGPNLSCKPTMSSTQRAWLCSMSSLTQFQPASRMASMAVSILFLSVLCRATHPATIHLPNKTPIADEEKSMRLPLSSLAALQYLANLQPELVPLAFVVHFLRSNRISFVASKPRES